MKYTLLEMTQDILSSMDSDQVNSITATTEARQVAEVIRTTYFNIIARANLPEHNKLFQLDASTDSSLPVLMHIPNTVAKIDWIKYNHVDENTDDPDSYQYVTILPMQQFFDMQHSLNPDEDNVDSMTYESITHYFYNDRMPSYCTIINDRYMIFDAYSSGIDTTLQKSKTMALGRVVPVFTLSNTFIPDLDEQQFPLLLNEAKSLAFLELKQITHEKAEQEAKRQWRTLQSTKKINKLDPMSTFADFGRHKHFRPFT